MLPIVWKVFEHINTYAINVAKLLIQENRFIHNMKYIHTKWSNLGEKSYYTLNYSMDHGIKTLIQQST